ncbi:hypothetical protein [Bradyrhizobium sp. dw_78]|uniref:hypothetical protein n=1 Tax=Bradyrhizobium sp. dw_78 TaxID=2719793 RepID=UPI001BD486C5|nr:hypothetical protein [Bradyrhizobium sp. dw_78]
MKQLAFIAVLLTLGVHAARADSCDKSRNYLLSDPDGDLTVPPTTYDDLFKKCLATIAMTNVKDAYILKDGGIAVVPKQDSVAATAATLSQFCETYPRATLHFLTAKERVRVKSIEGIVKISSTSSTSCQKIKGLS